MVAAPASQHKDFFELLGVPKRFQLDLGALERRYYELARTFHPDHAARALICGGSVSALMDAVTRMSELNQAYTTLKDPEKRRAYLLQLEGLGADVGVGAAGAKPGLRSQLMPMDLAEAWFELQDALTEGPSPELGQKIEIFDQELSQAVQEVERRVAELEGSYDAAPAREGLVELSNQLLKLNYLKSLGRDRQRLATMALKNG